MKLKFSLLLLAVVATSASAIGVTVIPARPVIIVRPAYVAPRAVIPARTVTPHVTTEPTPSAAKTPIITPTPTVIPPNTHHVHRPLPAASAASEPDRKKVDRRK